MGNSTDINSIDIGSTKGHPQFSELAKTLTENRYDYPRTRENILINIFTFLIKSLKRALLLPHHDVYLSNGNVMAIFPIVLKKIISRKKITLIVRSNDRFFHFQSFPFYQRILYRGIANHIDGVIAVSDMVKNYVERNSNCPVKKVNNFLKDNSYLDVEPNLSTENIVSIGTKYPRKGNDILFELDKKLRREKNYDGQTFILGNINPVPGFIKDYTENQANFHLVGYTEPKDYLKKGCFYIQPSRFDASSTCVLEAMAAGLIPLVSENTGNKELVKNIDSGLVLENEVDNYYNKITELMKLDREEKKKLSEKAKLIASGYTFDKIRVRFVKAIENLLKDIH